MIWNINAPILIQNNAHFGKKGESVKKIRDGCLKTAKKAVKLKNVVSLSRNSLALVVFINRATLTNPTSGWLKLHNGGLNVLSRRLVQARRLVKLPWLYTANDFLLTRQLSAWPSTDNIHVRMRIDCILNILVSDRSLFIAWGDFRLETVKFRWSLLECFFF